MTTDEGVLDQLVERIRADHAACINGDSSGYELADETSTVMGAFGACGMGASTTTPRQRVAAAQFESGSGTVELVHGGVSGDVAWVVMYERASVTFADRAEPVRWDLRVTEVFERRSDDWVRVHRHADPLVDLHPLDEVLSLLT